LIQCIFVSIRPDSNVNLPRPTYIHSNGQGFSSELLLYLLGAQGGGSTCHAQARPGVKELRIAIWLRGLKRWYLVLGGVAVGRDRVFEPQSDLELFSAKKIMNYILSYGSYNDQ
jgi:hypothetical protein